ncbi:MAG: FAD-dependent oxidoreductase [Bryobacteraceae bacterium]
MSTGRKSVRAIPATAQTSYDVVVIGAGVFGSWTAYHLRRAKKRVLLVDAYGASNARASSGGESRIIRCGYGADEIYSRFSKASLVQWKALSSRARIPLFHKTGVLWLGAAKDPRIAATAAVLGKLKVASETLGRADLEKRFPQFAFGNFATGVFEPESGALMARRSVQTLVQEMTASGLDLLLESVAPPPSKGRAAFVTTASGKKLSAGAFVFACGPWLPKVFPRELGKRIFTTRQEMFFFGPPPGDRRFTLGAFPAWIDAGNFYGLPDLENRGMKFADDAHGSDFDPDSNDRLVPKASLEKVRKHLVERFPAMKTAPLVESRVCQYENTSNGDFLLDRHPTVENIWFAGGGSGHGFKHGPAVGEYVAGRVLGTRDAEPRFSFANKGTVQKRSVY